LPDHEAGKEVGKLGVRLQRKYVCDVLVGTDDYDTPRVPINPSHLEHILARLEIGAEYLLVIFEPKLPLPGEKDVRHSLRIEFVVRLLEYPPDVERRVNVQPFSCISHNAASREFAALGSSISAKTNSRHLPSAVAA
jgi:hypothetical protein